MFKYLILASNFIFLITTGHASSKEDKCGKPLSRVAKAKEETRELLGRLAKRQGPVNSKPASGSTEPLSIDLISYLNSQNLGERLYPRIPIKSTKDLDDALNGRVSSSKIVQTQTETYPVDSFVVNDSIKWAAMTVHSSWLADGDKKYEGSLYLARIDLERKSLAHYDRITLPGAHAIRPILSKNGDHLLVTGVWTEGQNNLRMDLFYHNLSGLKAVPMESLGKKIDLKIERVTPIDSPDKTRQFFAIELKNPYQLAKEGKDNFLIVAADVESGTFEVLVKAAVPADVFQSISNFEYKDDRRGYLLQKGTRVKLASSSFEAEFSNSRLTGYQISEKSGLRRSPFAAWVLMTETEAHNPTFKFNNEVLGQSHTFSAEGVDYGGVVPVKDGFVFIERNHPHYGNYFMDPETQKPRLLLKERLIHADVHEEFIAGTTNSRGQDPTIVIKYYK